MAKAKTTPLEKLAVQYDNDALKVTAKLKSVQSIKCRLLKMKGTENYDKNLTELLKQEQQLKELRTYLTPKKRFVTQYEQDDVNNIMTLDEVNKAIKSIQSKKFHAQWQATEELEQAKSIEQMLQARKLQLTPIDEVKFSQVDTLIQELQNQDKVVDRDWLVEQLAKLKGISQ